MAKPKHKLKKTATYADDSKKVREFTSLCVEQCPALLMKSLFKLFNLRPSFFCKKTQLPCETDFSVGFTLSCLTVVLRFRATQNKALLLLSSDILRFLFEIGDE